MQARRMIDLFSASEEYENTISPEMIAKALPPGSRGQMVINDGDVYFRFGGQDARRVLERIRKEKESAQ